VLERSTDAADIESILRLVKEQQVTMIIVGMPFSLDGTLGSQAAKVRQWAEKLQTASSVPLEYRDERLTTVAAKNILEGNGRKRERFVKKGAYDAAAAAVILQAYLNEISPVTYPAEEPE
jgi:putative Holliday junction resolvase